MEIILISLLFCALFGFFALLTLNYTIYLWENKKINDLADKIKPASDDILSRNNVNRGFTSLDLGNNLHKSRAIAIYDVYERAIVALQKQDYPNWLQSLAREFEKMRKNFWLYLQQFLKYLSSLTKAADKEEEEAIVKLRQKQKSEISHLVNKVTNKESTITTLNLLDNPSDAKTSQTEVEDSDTPLLQDKKPLNGSATPSAKSGSVATISLAASQIQKDEDDMSVFEKLESRLLNKLKESGLNHYDIWLELGKLYEKYNEREKAIEIYALVLKHSQGKEKEFARDKLIALS